MAPQPAVLIALLALFHSSCVTLPTTPSPGGTKVLSLPILFSLVSGAPPLLSYCPCSSPFLNLSLITLLMVTGPLAWTYLAFASCSSARVMLAQYRYSSNVTFGSWMLGVSSMMSTTCPLPHSIDRELDFSCLSCEIDRSPASWLPSVTAGATGWPDMVAPGVSETGRLQAHDVIGANEYSYTGRMSHELPQREGMDYGLYVFYKPTWSDSGSSECFQSECPPGATVPDSRGYHLPFTPCFETPRDIYWRVGRDMPGRP